MASDQTIFATYQNARVGVFDISYAYRSNEIVAFVPPAPWRRVDHRPNRPLMIQTCEVFGFWEALMYSSDYNGGLYIFEYGAEVKACSLWTRVRNRIDQRPLRCRSGNEC